jgi:hypothetical protein
MMKAEWKYNRGPFIQQLAITAAVTPAVVALICNRKKNKLFN